LGDLRRFDRLKASQEREVMSFLLTLLTLLGLLPPPLAHYRSHGPALLNDLSATPGIVRSSDKSVVCHESTKALRKPGIQAVYTLYGAKKSPGVCCEIDHLISLELGGDNGLKNEWPQPYEPRPGAHEKDEVENWLHSQVCNGSMDLGEAQRRISSDWYEVYLEMKK
jgi:hypothetical protein